MYDNGTYYHTMIFVKSVLKGEVVVEGEGIYLTARGYNVQDLKDTYVEGKCSFTVNMADDQYTFTFDNTKGEAESMDSTEKKMNWNGKGFKLELSKPG